MMTLSVERLAEFRSRYVRWGGLFEAFDDRYALQFAEPQLTAAQEWRSRLRHVHFRPYTIQARVGFSEDTFARRSRRAEQELSAREGEFDVIFQLQTLFAPGLEDRPFVVYTDTTFARTWKGWPAWTPIPQATAVRFMELEREVADRADTVFTMSEDARRSFVDDYGCDPSRVINVGTAMALPLVDLDERRWDRPSVLFVGLDFTRKGGKDLLAVWPEVRAAVPQATLRVVGSRAPGINLPSGVEWLGRVWDRERLAQIYQEASVFALPTYFDPMPWVIGEAMAAGLACVVSPSCGIPELLQDGDSGVFVAAGARDQLAAALIELLRDPARCEQLGRRAHEVVAGSAHWNDVADRMAPGIQAAAARA